MKKILVVCGLASLLAGCNATVYTPRPVIYAEERRPLVVVQPEYNRYPLPTPRPYMEPVRRNHHCFTTWDKTPYGLRERVVCR
jgi:hypothetical protein